MNTPISEASSKWVLHRTWSMGDIVPSLAPLFWILTMLMRLERRITDMVPAMVFTVAGPFPIFNWSRLFITRSLKGPILTNKRNARTPSTKITMNNNWIILLRSPKNKNPHFCQMGCYHLRFENQNLPHKVVHASKWKKKKKNTHTLTHTTQLPLHLIKRRTLLKSNKHRPFCHFAETNRSTQWPTWMC